MNTETLKELEERIKRLEEVHYSSGEWERPEHTSIATNIQIHDKGYAGNNLECDYFCPQCNLNHHTAIHVPVQQTFPFKYRKSCENSVWSTTVIEFTAENVKK
jgi:hypothetical protein